MLLSEASILQKFLEADVYEGIMPQDITQRIRSCQDGKFKVAFQTPAPVMLEKGIVIAIELPRIMLEGSIITLDYDPDLTKVEKIGRASPERMLNLSRRPFCR
ncbi:hypothetical protein QR680_008101 [Steinernema hermaphroditum]|uniref:Uncharacterized protein n=1 Tax=Steinernema hermaphroditum TaxID=289476 RepID=A0AA39IHR6_9BILA|nr:hypothetical protein QR680_008101 [Steinernema hermaphroditum]